MKPSVTILLLGTGATGASIGLALRRAGENFRRVGYDPQAAVARRAQQSGAIDRAIGRPYAAAAEADLVVMSLAAPHALEVAQAVGADLRPDTVIVSVARLPAATLSTLRAAFGAAHPLFSAVPFLGARRALTPGDAPAPAADLYDGGMLAISAPPGTPQEAIQIGLDLAAILRATPFFLDPAELDSAWATSETLPELLAAAMLGSLRANPGWRDQRRLAGASFARLAAALQSVAPPEAAGTWVADREHLRARLDAVIEELTSLRSLLGSGDEAALRERLEEWTSLYQEWRTVRAEARPDLGIEQEGIPTVGMFDRLLGRRPATPKS